MQHYTERFFKEQSAGSRRSAEEIVPLILELIQPERVIDVGCGVGTWLSVFREHGIEDIWGVDGDYVDRRLLEIPEERFVSHDLRTLFRMDTRFDLVLSLEVAEHLPEDCAETFVDSLTKLGPVILFSAAIPYQEGAGHLNEQWPRYWTALFGERGFSVIDCIRRRIWNNERVEWWYAQNALVFVQTDKMHHWHRLKEESERQSVMPLSIVHPRRYLGLAEASQWNARLYRAVREIADLVQAGQSLIVVDEDLRGAIGNDREAIPFLERDGQYWGPPADDDTAIRELERLRQPGVSFIVFAWPAFWWLDHYADFRRYLESRFVCTLRNERMVVFDLQCELSES